MTAQTPGRQHQKTSVLSPKEQLGLGAAALLVLGLFAWHAALAVTTVIPWSGLGITMRALLAADPLGALPEKYAPAHPVWTITLFVALVAGVIGAGYWVTGRFRARKNRRAGEGTSTGRDIRDTAGIELARDKARYTRQASIASGDLDIDTAPVAEFGFQIGTSSGEPVVLTMEDQVGICGATGRGKTRYLMIGAALDAPGPLVATSTKLRDLDAIVTARSRVGRVFVFDPLDISSYPHPMFWDPTAGADDVTVAIARGQAFAGGLSTAKSEAGKFFQEATAEVIARLLIAAALSGKKMDSVVRWATDLTTHGTAAVDILTGNPDTRIWGATLNSSISGDPKTVANTQISISMACQPLLSPVVLRQLLPTAGATEFDPAAFVTSTDTLILITDDNARASVASLSTMLLNEVIDAAKAAAAVSGSDVLDPPLRIVGDEIANVAPVPKLPSMLSDSRGIGIQWVLAFQSLAQLTSRWGREDAEQILSNLNCTIVLGGLLDQAALDRFSALCGTTELSQVSASLDATHTTSGHNVTVTERTVMRPEEITQLKDGTALVLLRNLKPIIVNLQAYDQRPDGARITAEKTAAAAARRNHQAAKASRPAVVPLTKTLP